MTTRDIRLPCFKAYDIRGKVPSELDEELARDIGRAYAQLFKPRRIAIGRDMRLSSEAIAGALAEGFLMSGVDVVDIGLGGTELTYFAAFHLAKEGVDGGIAVTASHNPADYNGMKLVQRGAVPISGDSGLKDIEQLAAQGFAGVPASSSRGKRETVDLWPAYIEHLLSYVDAKSLQPFKIVANAGNGCAGLVVDRIEKHLPFSFIKMMNEPDGRFPNGVPNPILEENRAPTANAVKQHKAHLGLAWDGDHDRCFFFDDDGAFVEGYYMVGLFAEELLRKAAPGTAIIHDPRLVWNTIDLVTKAGGRPVMSKTGHAFIKERMRAENAVYGGEMSAHHYFRDFAYCDSGMIPWLLLTSAMTRTKKTLKELAADMQSRFPASGEINLQLPDAKKALTALRARYAPEAVSVDETDGVSVELKDWRVNVRSSNTEPVVRVNVESRGDVDLMKRKTDEVLFLLKNAW
jgi:phosphomannomutase